MLTREIPTHEWVPFLNAFSKRHVGEIATVRLLGREVGVASEGRNLPLLGVSVDVPGGEREIIEVMVGDAPDNNVSHAIQRPSRIEVATSDDGREQALQIESRDGVTTLIELFGGQRVAQAGD